MLAFFVTSASRRRLLELLWRHAESGSVTQLARRARISFATAYRELQRMQSFGLVDVRVESNVEVFSAAAKHPEADAIRRLVAAPSSAPSPQDKTANVVRGRAVTLGAPLVVAAKPVDDEQREEALVDAVKLAHRDATLARALPIAIAAQWTQLDRVRLKAVATRSKEKHALGFFLALTSVLADDESLERSSAGFRDYRRRGLRPFFASPTTRTSHALFERRTPAIAREWGYLMDITLADFRATFAKHVS